MAHFIPPLAAPASGSASRALALRRDFRYRLGDDS